MIAVTDLEDRHVEEAATLFVRGYAALHDALPETPAHFLDPQRTAERLGMMRGRALAAVEGGRLLGYLAWWQVESFRGSGRRAAYAPEWGHGTIPDGRERIYRALYRAASAEWAAAGCQVHAITLLASDQVARETWFWNGFGLTVVDATRPLVPLPREVSTSLSIRLATAADAEALSALDAQHVRHYAAPPIFMAMPAVDSPESFRGFVALPKNGVWLAAAGDELVGFMRFTGYDFDAVAVMESETAAFCSGLFVRPEFRGQRAAPAMLEAAIAHYAALGLEALYTNFESYNPEAAAFWMRHFRPACLSMTRAPEIGQ